MGTFYTKGLDKETWEWVGTTQMHIDIQCIQILTEQSSCGLKGVVSLRCLEHEALVA